MLNEKLIHNKIAYGASSLNRPPTLHERTVHSTSLGLLMKQTAADAEQTQQLFSTQQDFRTTKDHMTKILPYEGLQKLRARKEASVNSIHRDEYILRGLTAQTHLANANEIDLQKLPRKMQDAIAAKNEVSQRDVDIYNLIELCEETVRIPWKHIVSEHHPAGGLKHLAA